MPIYEFECRSCENRFEELVSSNGSTEVSCPACASTDAARLLSAFAIGSSGSKELASAMSMASGGGGCCGGSCGCC